MKLISRATLIDGRGGPPLEDAAVLVDDGGRIQAVGPRPAVAAPQDAQVFDATGMTLLPGLIDCHDHLSSFTYEIMSRWGMTEPLSLRRLRIARVMEDTLLTGYTTVRDCGWLDAGFKLAVEEGLIAGPRLLVATSPISSTVGNAERTSGSGHRPPTPLDPLLPRGIADGPDAIRAKVRELVRAGADLIKVFQTGWGRPEHGSTDVDYTREELDALVQEAHVRGRRVASHAVGGAGLRMSVEAGVDTIEHGSYLNRDPELLKMMADGNTFFVPTLTVFKFHAEHGTPHGRMEARDFRRDHVESVQQPWPRGSRSSRAPTPAAGSTATTPRSWSAWWKPG